MLLQADPVGHCQRQNIALVLVWPNMVALVFICICRYKALQGRGMSIRALTQPGYIHTYIHQVTLWGAVTTMTAVTFITGIQVLHTIASHSHWHKPRLCPSAVPQSRALAGHTLRGGATSPELIKREEKQEGRRNWNMQRDITTNGNSMYVLSSTQTSGSPG